MNKILIDGIYYNQTSDLELDNFPGKDKVVVAITGHRPNKLGGDYELKSPMIRAIEVRLHALVRLLKPDYMISGMALGIDTLWAQVAIYHNIPLIAAVPFKEQDIIWPDRSRSLYRELLKKAHMVVNVSGQLTYKSLHMQQRNEWMVDHCTKLIAVWDGSPGGTANCLNYAATKMPDSDIIIIQLNPKNI